MGGPRLTKAWQDSTRAARLPSDWATRRLRILKRDGWLCQLRGEGCTIRATEVDHIVAGDNHHPANLQASCHHCNAEKAKTEAREARAAKAARGKRLPEQHPGLTA